MNRIKPRTIFLDIIVLILGLACSVSGQQIPAGVRYKRATDELNQRAKTILESALAKTDGLSVVADTNDAMVCGPLLWDALREQAGKELREAKPIKVLINATLPKDGRGLITPEQKRAFWKLFVEKIKADHSFTVRKADADEIQYYWATIPFDIEEPLLVIDFGGQKVLVNFVLKNGEPKIFWLDVVGDLSKLK